MAAPFNALELSASDTCRLQTKPATCMKMVEDFSRKRFIAERSSTTCELSYYIVVETYPVLRYPEMLTGIPAMGLLGVIFCFTVAGIEFRVNRHLFVAS